MIRVQVDLTGRGQLADIGVHNTGETHPADSQLYKYTVYDISDTNLSEDGVTAGEELDEVWHYREDGAGPLLRKVFTQIGELPE